MWMIQLQVFHFRFRTLIKLIREPSCFLFCSVVHSWRLEKVSVGWSQLLFFYCDMHFPSITSFHARLHSFHWKSAIGCNFTLNLLNALITSYSDRALYGSAGVSSSPYAAAGIILQSRLAHEGLTADHLVTLKAMMKENGCEGLKGTNVRQNFMLFSFKAVWMMTYGWVF